MTSASGARIWHGTTSSIKRQRAHKATNNDIWSLGTVNCGENWIVARPVVFAHLHERSQVGVGLYLVVQRLCQEKAFVTAGNRRETAPGRSH